MKQVQRGELTVIKDMIYPQRKNNVKLYQKRNIENLRLQEEKNRRLKEEKENYVEPELYKLAQFKNVRINLKNKPINNYHILEKKRPNSIKINIQNKTKEENIYNPNNKNQNSLFEQYYNKSRSPSNNLRPLSQQNSFGINNYTTEEITQRNPIKSDLNLDELNENELNQLLKDYNEYITQKKTTKEIYPEIQQENIYNPQLQNNYNETNQIENHSQHPTINVTNSKDAEIEKMVQEYTSKYGYDDTIKQLVQEYNNKGKVELNSIPEADEKLEQTIKKPLNNNRGNTPLVLPKIQKNFIKDNRKIISEGKIQPRTKPKELPQPILHKDYGKTPLYIKKYEIENELKKEEKKRKEEEAKIP